MQQIVDYIARVETQPVEAGSALKILANFFSSVELADSHNYQNSLAPLFPKVVPSLTTFIKTSNNVKEAVVALYGIKFVARCSVTIPNLTPYLNIIMPILINEFDAQSSTALISIFYILSQSPSNIPALQNEMVVTFLQLFRSNIFASPHVDGLLENLTGIPEKKRDQPILAQFLQQKDGSKYYHALARGHAAESTIRYFGQHKLDVGILQNLYKISFFGAEDIAKDGVKRLVALASESLKVLEVLWMVSMRKRSRRVFYF